MSTTRRKGATPKKAHKVEVSFTNWVMGGSLLSLSTTSSLGSRVSSKDSRKSFDVETDDEEPPDPTPPAPTKSAKKKDAPLPESKRPDEKKVVCSDCQPEPKKSTTKCGPDCPVCNEECAWEKHMHEKYGGMECDTCGRGVTWLMDEFHKGRGEYACEKCTPDCAACGRGPLWLFKKWEKTLKRRARKLQGLEKDKKGKKDGDRKKDKEDEDGKKGKGDGGEKAKEKGKEKEKGKDKENEKAEDKSTEKDNDLTTKNDAAEKKNEGGKGKGGHDWTSEQDAKLKELKSQNKSWKDIASELGINGSLCKLRFKAIGQSGDAPTKKKNETSSGDKQNTSGGDDGDGFLGGFGDWNNDDSNKNEDNSGGNTDNQGWGATDTSNANGDNSGAANEGWGTSDNNNANTNAENSSWENNNSNTNAEASGGGNPNSSWDNNNNNTTGDSGNSGWGNDDSNKNSNVSGGNHDSQQNQNKNNGGGKKQQNKTKDNKQDNENELFAPITESNPTGYKPYKPSSTAADGASSWDTNGNTYFIHATTAQASGGLPNTGNAETSGSGWDAPKTDWVTIDPSNDNAGNEPVRDPWVQPELPKDSGNGGASDSWNNPATSAPAGDGWFNVTDSNLDIPTNYNAGMSWSQMQNGGGTDSWNKPDNASQKAGNGGNSWGQGNNSNNNAGNSWNKPDNSSQKGGNSWGQGNNSNNNNAGDSWNKQNNSNQNSGNGGNSWGQGVNNQNNNAGDSWSRPNAWNNSSSNNCNSGNNRGGFNSNNNSTGFNQGYSRGKLQPNGVWSPEDCIKLEFLESKYREHKWVEMQADFYNWTGRMIPAEQIEQKFKADGYA